MCGTGNAEVTLKGHDRKHFVVIPLDGPFRVKDMAPSIQALKKAAAASNGAVGVGLLSMMGFEHTRNELSVSCSYRAFSGLADTTKQVCCRNNVQYNKHLRC